MKKYTKESKRIGAKLSPYSVSNNWGPQNGKTYGSSRGYGFYSDVSDQDYITWKSQLMAEKLSKKELITDKDRTFYDGDLRSYNAYLNKTPYPRTVDFDGLQAIDLSNNGLKVQINPNVFTRPLNIQVPDTNDTDYKKQGREQRTVIRPVILGNSLLSLTDTIAALREALRQGYTETNQEQQQILETVKSVFKKLQETGLGLDKESLSVVKKSTSVLQIPKNYVEAGFGQRFINYDEFLRNTDGIMTFLVASSDDPESIRLYKFESDYPNNSTKTYSDILNIQMHLQNGHYVIDLLTRSLVPVSIARNETKNNLGYSGLQGIPSKTVPPNLPSHSPIPLDTDAFSRINRGREYVINSAEDFDNAERTESVVTEQEKIENRRKAEAARIEAKAKKEAMDIQNAINREKAMKKRAHDDQLKLAVLKRRYEIPNKTSISGTLELILERNGEKEDIDFVKSLIPSGQGKIIKGRGDIGNNYQKSPKKNYPRNTGQFFGYAI